MGWASGWPGHWAPGTGQARRGEATRRDPGGRARARLRLASLARCRCAPPPREVRREDVAQIPPESGRAAPPSLHKPPAALPQIARASTNKPPAPSTHRRTHGKSVASVPHDTQSPPSVRFLDSPLLFSIFREPAARRVHRLFAWAGGPWGEVGRFAPSHHAHAAAAAAARARQYKNRSEAIKKKRKKKDPPQPAQRSPKNQPAPREKTRETKKKTERIRERERGDTPS